MNLKLKRLVRTPHSEQYALFDLDQLDAQKQPMTIGKLDMHYTGEGVYGTILFWDDATRELSPARRENLIQALLEEIAQPMGVPNEFVVEFFAPTLSDYHVFHNLERDDHEKSSLEDFTPEADRDEYYLSSDESVDEDMEEFDTRSSASTPDNIAHIENNGHGESTNDGEAFPRVADADFSDSSSASESPAPEITIDE